MGAPKENNNAETWTEDEAFSFFTVAIEMSERPAKEYDFIGEIARDMGSYRDIFTYLKDKFKSCKVLYNILSSNLEANCFSHGKSGDIVPAMAIMNLKANYKWSDRVETTLQGGDKPIETKQTIISLGNGTKPNETIS